MHRIDFSTDLDRLGPNRFNLFSISRCGQRPKSGPTTSSRFLNLSSWSTCLSLDNSSQEKKTCLISIKIRHRLSIRTRLPKQKRCFFCSARRIVVRVVDTKENRPASLSVCVWLGCPNFYNLNVLPFEIFGLKIHVSNLFALRVCTCTNDREAKKMVTFDRFHDSFARLRSNSVNNT